MPDGYVIPPWLQAADPASAYARGVSLGQEASRLDLEAQRQAQAQATAERNAQLDLLSAAEGAARLGLSQQDEAIKQQQFAQQSEDRARQWAATQGYQQAIQSGADPEAALMQFGTAMGVNPSTLAATMMRTQGLSAWQQAELDLRKQQAAALDAWRQFQESKSPKAIRTLEPEPGTDEQGTLRGPDDDPAIVARLAARAKRKAEGTKPLELPDTVKQVGRGVLSQLPNIISSSLIGLPFPPIPLGGSAATNAPPAASISAPVRKEQMAQRANQLQAEHPDWTREQIMDAVKKEFSGDTSQ